MYMYMCVSYLQYYNVSKQAVGSFRYVEADGTKTIIPPKLMMEIKYYKISCGGKDESNLFPCE